MAAAATMKESKRQKRAAVAAEPAAAVFSDAPADAFADPPPAYAAAASSAAASSSASSPAAASSSAAAAASASSSAPCLEVCVDSVASAVAAESGGAQRVELCCALSDGGVTPSFGLIRRVRSAIGIQLHVLIRPRAGDFCYSDEEIAVMREDVSACKQAGAGGVVLGCLTAAGEIDSARMVEFVQLASPMTVTCHRAFDMTQNLERAAEALIACGVRRVLTSGGEADAIRGQEAIKSLVSRFSSRLTILAGGGLTPENIPAFVCATCVREVHASLRGDWRWGRMHFRKAGIFMGGEKRNDGMHVEYATKETDAGKVRAVVYGIAAAPAAAAAAAPAAAFPPPASAAGASASPASSPVAAAALAHGCKKRKSAPPAVVPRPAVPKFVMSSDVELIRCDRCKDDIYSHGFHDQNTTWYRCGTCHAEGKLFPESYDLCKICAVVCSERDHPHLITEFDVMIINSNPRPAPRACGGCSWNGPRGRGGGYGGIRGGRGGGRSI